jgi:transcriptional regulator with XRE-family HTH domain
MTRAELAAELGVSEGTVVRWELRTYGIADKYKPKIARILRRPLTSSWGGTRRRYARPALRAASRPKSRKSR